jgi:CheY-like chemotaxis protein
MAIQASLDLVRKRIPYDPKVTPLIENAMQAAQRGASLTQRMLAFARRQDLKRESVDVPALVRGMTELMQRTLGQAVSVETRFPLALPMVTTDANQLEAALLNLAINARDAMPQGGLITIAGRLETLGDNDARQLAPGRYVSLSVTDEGEGMDEETLRRAAEPFFTTKGVGKGTGLGLPMVHGLAEQSGGRLVLRSKPGRGTTAEIWLPVAEGRLPGAGSGEQSGTQAATPTRALNILAVDDDALVLFNTVAMLEELGHKVFDASSGRAALGVLERQPIDLLITDQGMPGMTGVQLGQLVREKWPRTQIIIATGYAELPAGSPSFPKLNKPFLEAELQEAIAALERSS